MAVCQGITYNATDNRITIQFVSGDVKGNSFNDPYTLQDIYDTDVDNGWGVFQKYGNVYISNASIHIEGADTYFQNGGFVLSFQGDFNDTYIFYVSNDANVKILDNSNNLAHIRGNEDNRIYFDSNVIIDNAVIDNFLRIYLYKGDFVNLKLNNYTVIRQTTFKDIVSNDIFLFLDTPTTLQDIKIYNTVNVRDNIGNLIFENLTVSTTNNDIELQFRGGNAIHRFINSLIDLDSYQTQILGEGTITIKSESTFKITISYGDGGIATLYDQFGNQVAQQVLSGEWALADPVLYAKRYVETDGSQVVENTKTVYEPFKLVVEKPNMQDLVIDNITVTPGEETSVYGKMIEKNYIDRTLGIGIDTEEISMSLETTELSLNPE